MSNSEELRFFVEAEFVQALANIDYVVWLAKQDYFEDEAFLNFLKYLNEKVREVLKEDPLSFRRIVMDQLWSSWARKTELN
jgi:hypothetical protein